MTNRAGGRLLGTIYAALRAGCPAGCCLRGTQLHRNERRQAWRRVGSSGCSGTFRSRVLMSLHAPA
eukprot:7386177-Prymnesium_polylepis.2